MPRRGLHVDNNQVDCVQVHIGPAYEKSGSGTFFIARHGAFLFTLYWTGNDWVVGGKELSNWVE